MTTKKNDYQSLSQELEAVMAALENPMVQVDEAVELYERGLKLVTELEAHLKKAENTISKLKLQAAKD